jgi:hypothetical protein
MSLTTINLQGLTINGLFIIQRSSLSASKNITWQTECIKCGTVSNIPHQHLINAMGSANGGTGFAQCGISECRLFGTFKKQVIKPLEPLLDVVPVTVKPAVTGMRQAKPVIKSKDQLEYERICLSRAYYELDPLTQSQVELVKRYQPKIFNKVLATVECYETATGGNI